MLYLVNMICNSWYTNVTQSSSSWRLCSHLSGVSGAYGAWSDYRSTIYCVGEDRCWSRRVDLVRGEFWDNSRASGWACSQ